MVGKNVINYENQSTDPLSLRERAGVRVKCLNTHQLPVGTSLLAPLPKLKIEIHPRPMLQ